ncbi:MAG: glutathione binding-like protein, partial [Rhodanobacteraceae bacterium]
MGDSPKAKAVIEMWNRRMEAEGFTAAVEGLRNHATGFKVRAVTGPHTIAQIPDLAERGRLRFQNFLQDLDARLQVSSYVAGDAFSIADITALVAVEFGTRAGKVPVADGLANVHRWYREVSSRPSAGA